MTVQEQRLISPYPFSYVHAGEIPETGAAIKDGDVYYFGRRVGVLLRVEYMASLVHVIYLQEVSA